MLDKSIPFKHIYMKIAAQDLLQVQVPALPQGYCFRFYQPGDEKHWAKLELAVAEFETDQAALERYQAEFLPGGERLEKLRVQYHLPAIDLTKRQVFIEDAKGQVVATATAWFADKQGVFQPILHWVSVDPTRQGLGLGQAVVAKVLSLFPELNPGQDVMLHTQTWSYPAVVLYHKLGFYLCKNEGLRLDNDYHHGLLGVLATVIKEPMLTEIKQAAK